MFGFLKNAFSPPTLLEKEASDFGKVAVFVGWFIRKDHVVRTLTGHASNLFHSGLFPSFWEKESLESALQQRGGSKESPIGDWLIVHIFNDLNSPDRITKDYIYNLIVISDEINVMSTNEAWRIAQQYHMKGEDILFEPETSKITENENKIRFQQHLLDVYCTGAEIRILNWFLQKNFNTQYRTKGT